MQRETVKYGEVRQQYQTCYDSQPDIFERGSERGQKDLYPKGQDLLEIMSFKMMHYAKPEMQGTMACEL